MSSSIPSRICRIVFGDQGLSVLLPCLFVGVLSLLTGLGLIGGAAVATAKEEKLALVAATGLRGTATITGVELTGTEINGRPQWHLIVNVSLPDCRVDPADLSLVVVVNDPEIARRTSAALLAGGVPGRARVLGWYRPAPDGLFEPPWGLRISIQIDDGRPPYEIRLTTTYPPGQERPGKGAVLPVRIDPDEPSRIAVDWDAFSAPGSLPRALTEPPPLADAEPQDR